MEVLPVQRIVISIVMLLALFAAMTAPVGAEGTEMCVTINGNRVCGESQDIALLLEITNPQEPVEFEPQIIDAEVTAEASAEPTMQVTPKPDVTKAVAPSIIAPGNRLTEGGRSLPSQPQTLNIPEPTVVPQTETTLGQTIPDTGGWDVPNAPAVVVPLKYFNGEANPQSCSIPKACWIFNASGVLSADDRAEALANPSAVWSAAGDVQHVPENTTSRFLLWESGYMMVSGNGFTVTCGSGTQWAQTYTIEGHEGRAAFLVLRGLHEGEGDRSLNCDFSGYNPGAILVTLFATPESASAFFSQGYYHDNVANALFRKNCGATGCDEAIGIAGDLNDGAYTVDYYSDATGWLWVADNVKKAG